MAGVYFVLHEDYGKCWIDDSATCNKDAQLLSAGCCGGQPFVYIIRTNPVERTGLMEFILEKLENKNNHKNWYELTGVETGYLIRQTEEYLSKHIFHEYNGSVCVFDTYEETEDRAAMRKTI
jgi:hypothetical protein